MLSDFYTFGAVLSTIMVVVVTAQVCGGGCDCTFFFSLVELVVTVHVCFSGRVVMVVWLVVV